MTVRRRITRRGLALTGLAIGFLGAGVRLPAGGSEGQARRVLDAISGDWRGAQPVGHYYLKQAGPAEASIDRLLALILPEGALPASDRALSALIHDRVRREFGEGAVVTVDGWMLSPTEARLYALAAVLS